MSEEEFLFYFCREFDKISTHCWVASLSLSLQKRIYDFKNSEDLMAEFISKKATLHKSCVSLYDKVKLNRKWKLQVNQDQVDQTPEESTRKTLALNTDSSKCLFCDASKQSEELHLCQKLELDMRIGR